MIPPEYHDVYKPLEHEIIPIEDFPNQTVASLSSSVDLSTLVGA